MKISIKYQQVNQLAEIAITLPEFTLQCEIDFHLH